MINLSATFSGMAAVEWMYDPMQGSRGTSRSPSALTGGPILWLPRLTQKAACEQKTENVCIFKCLSAIQMEVINRL